MFISILCPPSFLFLFFFFPRLPVVCLQRAYDPGRSRKPHSHCSPNRHLGVCCYRIPSAHCVLEQTWWEKIPDQIKEKTSGGFMLCCICCLDLSFYAWLCVCVWGIMCHWAEVQPQCAFMQGEVSCGSYGLCVLMRLYAVCSTALIYPALRYVHVCAEYIWYSIASIRIHEAMGFNIRPQG